MRQALPWMLLVGVGCSTAAIGQTCNVVAGVLTLADGATCVIAADHPRVLQGLVMGRDSTLVIRDVPGHDWQVDIKKASFAPGARWDLRGGDAEDWRGTAPSTPKQASYCENGRKGRTGAPGGNGGEGIGLDLIVGLADLQEWRIDGSGGKGGAAGPGGKGAKGGDAQMRCSASGKGGGGGPGGRGGNGGDTSDIRIRYYWLAEATDLAQQLASTSALARVEELLAASPQQEQAFPAGLQFDSEPGIGGDGAAGGPGGAAGKRKCGAWCTGRGSNGHRGPGGASGTDGEHLAEQVVLIKPPVEP